MPEMQGAINPYALPDAWEDEHFADMVRAGLELGDAECDQIAHTQLLVHMRTGLKLPYLDAVPAWVDREKIEQGQQVYRRCYMMYSLILFSSLVNGFLLARFSEVLAMSGYAADPRQARRRFGDTGMHILLWMTGDLLDPDSEARQSISKVRCMHAHARLVAKSRCSVGLPVSQMDMALVLMSFSTLPLDVMVNDMQVPLSEFNQDCFLHLWRYIGYLLGIEHEYNICSSRGSARAFTHKFYSMVPHYTPSEASCLLVHTTTEGFATYGGMGQDVARALVSMSLPTKPWLSCKWMGLRSPSPAAILFVTGVVWLYRRYPQWNTGLVDRILARRAEIQARRSNPDKLRAFEDKLVTIGRVMDWILGFLSLPLRILRITIPCNFDRIMTVPGDHIHLPVVQ